MSARVGLIAHPANRKRRWAQLRRGVAAAAGGVLLFAPSTGAQGSGEQMEFQARVVPRHEWTRDEYPPPGIWPVAHSVVVVEEMSLPTPCHQVPVDVTGHGTAITVRFGRPYRAFRPGQVCAARVARVYMVLTIEGLAPGSYSVEVHTPPRFRSFRLPAEP